MIRSAAICSLACVLSGCNAFYIQRAGTPAYESRQVSDLIAYTQRVAAQRADEQRRELNASSQMFSKDRDAYSRMRLALLLALPGTVFNDDARATSLLEPLANNTEPGPMQQFAGLVHSHVSERARRSAQMKEQLETMKVMERNANQLKEQLDAMRAIERKLMERELTRPR